MVVEVQVILVVKLTNMGGLMKTDKLIAMAQVEVPMALVVIIVLLLVLVQVY